MLVGMLDIGNWVTQLGLFAVLSAIGLIVFAESGLLVGIFLPGDTLLFAAGLVVAQGDLPLILTMFVIFIAAVLGDNTGYFFGKATGQRLLHRKRGLFFRGDNIGRAEAYFKKYGAKTVFLARFVPYIRTFTPIVAGIGHMDRKLFIAYNFAGALAWTVMTVLIGYWFGTKIPDIQQYMLPAVLIGIAIFFAPTLWHLWQIRRSRHG